MSILALITGRGGSKRVPGKNIRTLGGIPLIAWSIKCARQSKLINRIIVTTDNDDIADVARSYGVEIPFMRPAAYANDTAPEILAVKHALDWLLENQGYEPELVALLRPTSPFRRPGTVDRALSLLRDETWAHSVRSVSKCKEHPHKMWKLENGCLISFIPYDQKVAEAHNLGYQVLPEAWIQNASFDIIRPSIVREFNSTTGQLILPCIMDEFEAVDINTEIDFLVAEAVLEKLRQTDGYYSKG